MIQRPTIDKVKNVKYRIYALGWVNKYREVNKGWLGAIFNVKYENCVAAILDVHIFWKGDGQQFWTSITFWKLCCCNLRRAVIFHPAAVRPPLFATLAEIANYHLSFVGDGDSKNIKARLLGNSLASVVMMWDPFGFICKTSRDCQLSSLMMMKIVILPYLQH